MLTIRKSLFVAAALALAPAFAFAQTGTPTAKTPAAVMSTQGTVAATKAPTASVTPAKASAMKTHKSRTHHAAKVKKTKTAKGAKSHKLAQHNKTPKTAGTVMKVTPGAAQK